MNKPSTPGGKPSTYADIRRYVLGTEKRPDSRPKGDDCARKDRRPKPRKGDDDVATAIRKVFLKEIFVRESGRQRKQIAIVALLRKIFASAVSGDKKLTALSYQIAKDFGVFKLKGKKEVDLSNLTPEEFEIIEKATSALRKAYAVVRFEQDLT
jgi:hypothetical protein